MIYLVDDVLRKNIIWNLKQVAIQISHAGKVKGKARSGYYKIALMLSCSIVEALAHELLKRNLKKISSEDKRLLENYRCFESHFLPIKFSVDEYRLSVCKRRREKFELNRNTDFKKINEVCLRLNIFSKKDF
ncbi:MAG: hypothetical protein FJZ04_00560 [Candidatus Moranbacteria bacterium]|nr:hypothetical protein [Candidatus Moranbacteria bacterium]